MQGWVSLASLAGLQYALEQNDDNAIADAIQEILLLHSIIMSFGGIPLLYYGDELGTLNDMSFQNDQHKAGDTRWVHRPTIDWDKAENRNDPGTVEYNIFTSLKRMIAVRKEIEVFADFNNRELIDTENPHLFAFARYSLTKPAERVVVIANFDGKPQKLDLNEVYNRSSSFGQLVDLYSGRTPETFKDILVIPPYGFYWLCEMV